MDGSQNPEQFTVDSEFRSSYTKRTDHRRSTRRYRTDNRLMYFDRQPAFRVFPFGLPVIVIYVHSVKHDISVFVDDFDHCRRVTVVFGYCGGFVVRRTLDIFPSLVVQETDCE